MVTPVLEASGLVKRYGGRTVVADVSLTLEAGEVLALAGPNGAGKSTLFRLLLLLERSDAGTIRIDGVPVRGRSMAVRGRLSGVFQRAALFSGTVRDNVGYGLRVRGVARRERDRRVAQALEWFGLGALAGTSVHALSGGEGQRVALARALVTEPDVLVLDEPAAGLDASMRRRFRADLEQVARRHARSIVLITHDPADAFGIADRMAIMEAGRIVQQATPEQVVLRPATPFAAELTGAELLLHGSVEERREGLYGIAVAPGVRLWARAASGGLRQGARAVVAYRPEDIVLAGENGATGGSSALNRLPVTVAAMAPAGGVVRVLLRAGDGSIRLTALLTAHSAAALSLQTGSRVVAVMKATALHAWERSGTHDGGARGTEATSDGRSGPQLH